MEKETTIERWYGCYGGGRGDLFLPESNRHPAKMAVGLCERIFIHGCQRGYWKAGDVVMDPMCGIGTTLVVGAALGYRVLGIELETHFQKLGWANILHAEKSGVPAQRMAIIPGDARRLAEIVGGRAGGRAGGCITSPPYLNVKDYGPDGTDKVGERTYSSRTVSGAHSEPAVAGAITSPPYSDAMATAENGGYSADGAVTSLPYADQELQRELHGEPTRREKSPTGRDYSVDGKNGAQIGNLRNPKNDIDAAVQGKQNGQETYCAAMLEVYRQLHAVLKPGGVVALVTKNPVKGGKIRRLDSDTIRLMEAAGFGLIERVMAMLVGQSSTQTGMFGEDKTMRTEQKSFFKRLHEKKFPHLAVDHEDVLFFRKLANDQTGA